MKHSILLSKVRKSSDKPTGQRKRRRSSKKLVTTLENLADALPEVTSGSVSESKSSKMQGPTMETLKSRPGVGKKKDRIVRQEKERFGRNMAALTQTMATTSKNQDETQDEQTNSRWAALRSHLANTVGKT
jgi:hypothetical protein